MSEVAGSVEQDEKRLVEEQAAEVEAVRAKLAKIFRQYIRLAFLCLFFMVFGILVMLILLLVDIFRLRSAYKKLKVNNATDAFGEYGEPLAWSMLLTLTLFLAFVGPMPFFFPHGTYEVGERQALLVIYDSLQDYAKEHDGSYPVSGWDREILDGRKLEFAEGVALNPAAIKLGTAMPDDMVLGFVDGKDGSGRQEVFNEHDAGLFMNYGFLFGNGSVSHVSSMQFKYLRWTEKEAPEPKVNRAGIIIVLGLIVAALALIKIKSRDVAMKAASITSNYTFAAGFIGFFFGIYALLYHNLFLLRGSNYMQFSAFGPAVLGIVTLSGYVPLMAMMKQRCKYEYFRGWATVYGSLAGILCSTISHILLSFICLDCPVWPVLAALPFGAWAGMVIGWLVGKRLDEQKVAQVNM